MTSNACGCGFTMRSRDLSSTGTLISLITRCFNRFRMLPPAVGEYIHSSVTLMAFRRHSHTSYPARSHASQTSSRISSGGRPAAREIHLRMHIYEFMKKQKHTAYKFQVLRIRDAGEQHIDLPHCEHALQTTTDKVLD